MGFCLYNNVAVAAAARAAPAASTRVAIVDIDVHHGNGTQWMFYDDPRVLYVSTHQFPFYPGHRRGRRDRARVTDAASRSTCRSKPARPMPTTRSSTRSSSCRCSMQFAPELMIVSAGFDAHETRSAGVDADVVATDTPAIVAAVASRRRQPRRAGAASPKAATTCSALRECLEASFDALDGTDPA